MKLENPAEIMVKYEKFRNFELLNAAKDALDLFEGHDEISMEFIFSECPTPEEAEKRNYVKEFEQELFGKIAETGVTPF